MTPSEWPLRLIPRQSPPVWRAALVTVLAVAGAILIRGLMLGFDNATGISATYFPAFIIATLYGGPRWGWLTLVGVTVMGSFGASITASTVSRDMVTAQFALSGAATIMVAGALRGALVRLNQSRAAEAKVQVDLAATEARFRNLADSAPVLMWVSRLDGRREFANLAYLAFMGVNYETALDFDWRAQLHPDDRGRIAAEEAAGEALGGDFIWEARYQRFDRQYRWIRSVSQPRFSADGQLTGYIGVGYDITDAKQAQADLTRINDLLAERVQAALSERDEAEAALRRAQKLEAVGQLTGGVAHDFNNLLTVIVGALDLMQRHPGDEARRERMIEAAQTAARRGERLTQQLLAFSRRQALKPELALVDELLADSETLLRRAVGEAVNLSVNLAAPDSVANIDASQFEAAVMNLVVNARDATPAGGSIRLETHPCAVAGGEVDELEAGDYLCVVVHDTGAGMTADVVQRVFEPFFTTKEPGRGTGLGLSQVYGFAHQSGGAVAVDSAPGRGTTIRIYLPLAQAGAARRAALAPLAATTPHGPAQRILLVEDDLAVGDMVAAMLTDLGHAVIRADGAPAALVILRQGEPIDLMLTDLIMPGGKSGVELAHETVALRPGLPIILSSGYTGETLGPAANAPWPLLKKPYAAETLAAVIDAAIGRVSEKA